MVEGPGPVSSAAELVPRPLDCASRGIPDQLYYPINSNIVLGGQLDKLLAGAPEVGPGGR